jgi:GTP cyclohydrolase N terminal.
MSTNRDGHIRLTSHPGHRARDRYPINWNAATARERGPLIGTVTSPAERNTIGAHGGSYALYRALAVSSGALNPMVRPDLTNTAPVVDIGPCPQWSEPGRIVSLDPWGHRVALDFAREIAEGLDIRPTIAVTKARLTIPEFAAQGQKWVEIDGEIVRPGGDFAVTKAAIDPVWHLPGIAERFQISEDKLRRTLFEQTGGIYPELVDAAGLVGVSAADRRHHTLHLRRSLSAREPQAIAHLPGPRRVQRLRRVRIRHLHLPPLPHPRHRRMREVGTERRHRTHCL